MSIWTMRRILLILGFVALGGAAHADTRYKLGLELNAFKPNPYPNVGWMSGLRFSRYFGTSNVSLGAAAYYGSPTGGNLELEHVAFAGLLLSFEKKVGRSVILGFDLTMGLGEGQYVQEGIKQTSYFGVLPAFSAGLNLGSGWRLAGTLQYLYMSNALLFNGPFVGFRIDSRSATSLKDSND